MQTGYLGLKKLRLKSFSKITNVMLADVAFIFYFCAPAFRSVIGKICALLDISGAVGMLTSVIVYLPMLALLLLKYKRAIPKDFVILWMGVVFFFGATLLVHPEYYERYSHEEYGVLNYVLLPIEGLYAYWFVRLVNDPKRLLKNMKTAGWLMYVYFAYQIYAATQRGYWQGVTFKSSSAEMSYSVSFGYNVLLFLLPFFYDALRKRKPSDIIGTAVGLVMILTNGSRGPMLFIALFLLLMGILYLERSRKKWIILLATIAVFVVLAMFYDMIIMGIMSLLSSLNVSSRFISMILDGTIMNNNGRSEIWGAAVEMISENPFGYGAMGSQHVISKIIPAGYPHSIVLEIMIDFGVVIGGALLIWLFYNAATMLFAKKNKEWTGIFLIFFGTACQLFVSLCYWSSPAFWACVAVAVNCHLQRRKEKRRI